METIPLQRILEALRESFQANTNSAVQQATKTLAQLSRQPGYLACLVEIVLQQRDELLIYAALAQLKNQLRERWRAIGRKNTIPSSDKVYFLQWLMEMNVRMMGNQGFFKLLKDLVVIVADGAISLLPQILQMLESGIHLKACLNLLLGISQFYRFESSQQDKNSFHNQLEKILPSVLGLVHKGEQHLLSLYEQIQHEPTQHLVGTYNRQKQHFQEILYLSIKLVYKCISTFLPTNLIPFLIEWASIAIGRLAEENDEHDKHAASHPHQCGRRGADMFNYFHGKKWSAKFMIKFIEKVLVSKKSAPEITNLTEEFYLLRGGQLQTTVLELLKRQKPNSVRFYEIYLIDMIFQRRPQLLEKYTRVFLFQILPKFFLPSQSEVQLLKTNPKDFLILESYQGHQSKNAKLVANSLWVQLAFSDSANKREGELLLESLQQINVWLFDACLQIKQIAVYLLAQISFRINDYEKGRQTVSGLLSICIPAIFEQPNLLLQVRGFELIKAYPLLLQSNMFEPLTKMVLNIFKESLSNRTNLPLAIYGGIALEKLLFYGDRTGLKLCDSDVRIILRVLLQLIKSEELEQLSQTLLTLAEAYSQQISIYSVELANHLFSTYEAVIDRAEVQGGNFLHIQSVLNILQELVNISNSSNPQEVPLLQALEEGVATSIESLLMRQSPSIVNQYLEGLLKLLNSLINAQTNQKKELSPMLSFPYIFLITNHSPLQPSALEALQVSTLTYAQKKILTRQDLNLSLDTQISFQLFRNYLKFLGKNPETFKLLKQDELSKQFFSTDPLNQFMNMVYFYFRIPHGHISTGQLSQLCRGRYLSTHLLISLLQNHQQLSPFLLKKIVQIMIINIKSEKVSQKLVKCNFMLFCAWLARAPDPLKPLQEALNSPSYKIALRLIIPTGKNMLNQLRTPLERRRAIIAFAQLIQLAIIDTSLRSMLHFIFTWQLYLLDLNFARRSEDEELGITEQSEPKPFELEYEIDEQCSDYIAVEEPNEFLIAMMSFKKLKCYDVHLFREHALNANYYSFLKLYQLAHLDQDPELRDLLAQR